MDAKKMISAIKGNRIFVRCHEEELLSLIEKGMIGERTFESGEEAVGGEGFERSMGILVSGKLRVERLDDDRRILLNIIRQGGCFGVASMFGGDDAHTLVSASSRSKVLYINEEGLSSLLLRIPELSVDYITFLTDRIRFLNSKIRSFTGGSSEARLAALLAESADEEGVCALPSMAQLARRLDISRASLYRSLASLEQSGSIRRDGKTVVLVDR